jgi:glycosyltransferase involved in cell wall biosynthesis
MRLAYVVPRYGTEVVGGAELGARMLAERLAALPGWSVEVLTTCALDHMTWADHYPPGDRTEAGVLVRRYRSHVGRPPAFFPYSERLLAHASSATVAEAERFIDLQGPICPELVEAALDGDYDLVACYPYLYATTVRVLPRLATASVLHPAAHDEPALSLPVFRPVFAAAHSFAFHTEAERRLVGRRFPIGHRPQVVVGLGFDAPPAPADAAAGGPADPSDAAAEVLARQLAEVGDRPFLLCLGRVDGLKGTTMLAGFFAAYKQRRPGPLLLVVAGPVTAGPPEHPDVVVTGPVDETLKWALLRRAVAVVQPSPNEAFSLVLMEAWSQGRPVVVNGRCLATREHCERSGGGLWFDSYPAFEVVLDRLLADSALRQEMGRRGQRYADSTFRWPVVIDRYRKLYEATAARAAVPWGRSGRAVP